MPVVIYIKPPRTPLHLPHLPQFSEKSTKIITVLAAVVISLTMVSFVVYAVITNSDAFKRSHGLETATTGQTNAQTNGSTVSAAAAPGGATAIGTGGSSGANSPVVTLSASPGSVTLGGASRLQWSSTNNPTSCTASDDWSGNKPAAGEESTPPLTKVQSYLFTITCRNASGTGFSTVSVGATSQTGTGSVGRPVVTLAANPSAIYIGDKTTLIWSATGNPTSCAASGNWSGARPGSGSENTPVLSTPKKYTYSLTCKNDAGTGTATATVLANPPPPNIPNVNLSTSALGSVKPGATVTVSWTVANNPTSCTASGDWSGARGSSGSQVVGPLNTIKTYEFYMTCRNAAGSGFDGIPVVVMPDPPVVSLTANPATVLRNGSTVLIWSSTNNPTSCTASGAWTGSKPASGIQSTGALVAISMYYYNLSCTNAAGTGYANNVGVRVVPPPPPVVTLSVSPISINTGGSATISWSSTNSAAYCTAGGDWSGTKAGSGAQNTGVLSTARTYNYTLSCVNAGGTGSASAGLTVSTPVSTVTKPTVTIVVNPVNIGVGSASTISWSAGNNPTSCSAGGSWSGAVAASGSASTGNIGAAGSYTYSLTCSNSAGSSTASATLTALATSAINISVSPSAITAGASATLTWSVTNNPTSCSAGGSWSGSKAASGSQAVSPAAGSYSYTLSCVNSGGTSSASANLTVNAVQVVYCGGKTPCYGKTDLSQHANPGSCWGWNLDWVIDITSYAPDHKGGASAGSLESASSTCNHDIHSILDGSVGIPGYKDDNGHTTHGHASSTVNNSSGTALASYFVGYYDPAKP